MPTLSFTALKAARDNLNTHKVIFADYNGPSSYATGGDPFAPSDFGWSNLDFVDVGMAWSGSAVRLIAWDKANNKLVWYIPNTGAEVAAAQDLSTFTARIMVAGHG